MPEEETQKQTPDTKKLSQERFLSWKDIRKTREPVESQCKRRMMELKKTLSRSWMEKIGRIELEKKLTELKKNLPEKMEVLWFEAKIFLQDHFHLVLKSAAENHLRIHNRGTWNMRSEDWGRGHGSSGLEKSTDQKKRTITNLEFDSFSHLKRYQKKVRLVTFSLSSTLAAIMILAMMLQLFPTSSIRAASYSFAQTDWSGGANAANAIHPTNATEWNKYVSKDDGVTAVNSGADLTLTATNGSVTQTDDGATNTGFNLAGKSFSQSEINGSGSSASVTLSDADNWTVSTLDASTHITGTYTSLNIGSDGFSRISYSDSFASSGYLDFIQCTNAACSTKNTTTVDK